jgi:nudix-type nucleoside diphosphatase (YffH/AdpP family)
VTIVDVQLVSTGWHVLRRTTFDYRHGDGTSTREQRETYDRGNGATILLYDPGRATVLLTKQFRYPVYVNDHPDGMFLETAAGLLDDDSPEDAIRREVAEETGVAVGELQHVFDVYMSPGSVTERVHFYAAPYSPSSRLDGGGGVATEGEDIEVIEIPFTQAMAMIRSGEIADAKTIMLLQWAALEGPFRSSDTSQMNALRKGEGFMTEPRSWFALMHQAGPSVGEGDSVADHPGIGEHYAFLRRRIDDHTLVAAGPLLDEPGSGMTVLALESIEEARRLAEEDDLSVVSGVLKVTVRPWHVIMAPMID